MNSIVDWLPIVIQISLCITYLFFRHLHTQIYAYNGNAIDVSCETTVLGTPVPGRLPASRICTNNVTVGISSTQ